MESAGARIVTRAVGQRLLITLLVGVAVTGLTLAAALPARGSSDAPAFSGLAPGTDSDSDGCTDAQELGADEILGGRRDPQNFWDFYDTPDASNVRDRSVSVADLFRITARLGATGSARSVADALSAPPASGYHASYDRSSPAAGGDSWDLRSADGAIGAADIAGVVDQFGHSCGGGAPAMLQLLVSSSSNRAAPQALQGGMVSGDIYVFTSPDDGVVSVSFYLDDPNRAGVPRQVESGAPFDFAGGSVSQASPFNSAQLSNGLHTITAVAELSAGGTAVLSATFTVSNSGSVVTPTPPPGTPVPTPTSPITSWAFQETFDGTPAAPQPFSSPRFDIVVGGSDPDGIMDGQVVHPDDSLTYDPIEVGHGPDCGAPINRGDLNNHLIDLDDEDENAFQTDWRQHFVFNCSNHMMTAVKAGYAVASLMPRQLFDWSGRTGTVEFETSMYTSGEREWWDTYIVPEDEMLQEIGPTEEMPKRAVRFSLLSNLPSVAVIDDYRVVHEWKHWQQFKSAFPNDPALTDPRIRRVVRMSVSQTGWSYEIQKQDGTFWTFSGTFPQPLSFTRGAVRIEHHAYNPTKDGIFGVPWSQYTYHWDNIRFDGPVVPARRAYEAAPGMVDLLGSSVGSVSAPVTLNVGSNTQPRLVAHLYSRLHQVDAENTSHWMQVRVNGGAWQDMKLRKGATWDLPPERDRTWSTVDTPLTGLVVGQNTLQFRYNARPANADWRGDGFRVKDIEIQVDDRALVATAAEIGGDRLASSDLICEVPPDGAPAPTMAVDRRSWALAALAA